jgi:Family of unknown function (DUF5675)
MKIKVIRTLHADCTTGEMFIDDKFFGYTLEDIVRPDGVKIYGETAIPQGTYKVVVNFSNRFKRQMCQLFNITGSNIKFGDYSLDAAGIRIHGGNTTKDTLGCILLGKNKNGNQISNCAEINQLLVGKVKEADLVGDVTIEIVNQYNFVA